MSRRAWALLVAAVLIAAACNNDNNDNDGNGATAQRHETVRVFAASSLTEAFTELGDAFEDTAGGENADVEFQFGASSTLAQQIESGAVAAVFVSADEESMARAAPGAATVTIARNRLALVVEKGNPKGIDSLDDLARPGVLLVVCAPAVPCGRLGAAMLAKSGAGAKPASLEENVKAVVAKVALGEADAGIVYGSDIGAAEAAGTAEGVSIPLAADPALEAVYPMAVLEPTAGAKAWAAFVTSDRGRRVLAAHGFLPGGP